MTLYKAGMVARVWAGAAFFAVLTFNVPKLVEAVKSVDETVKLLPSQVVDPVTAMVDEQATALQIRMDGQLDKIRSDSNKLLTGVVVRTDNRVGDTLVLAGEVLTAADRNIGEGLKRVDAGVAVVENLRADAKPLLANSAGLVKNVNDTIDDNYLEIRGSIASFEMAATQIAYTTGFARDAAPGFLQDFKKTSDSVAGITNDVHSMTTYVDQTYIHPPKKSLKQKIVSGFKDGLSLGVGIGRVVK